MNKQKRGFVLPKTVVVMVVVFACVMSLFSVNSAFFGDLDVAIIKKNAAEEDVIRLYKQISELMSQIDVQTVVVEQHQEQLKNSLSQIGEKLESNMQDARDKMQKIVFSGGEANAIQMVGELSLINTLLVENVKLVACAQNLQDAANLEDALLQQKHTELKELQVELMRKKQEIYSSMVEIATHNADASEYLDQLNYANENYKDILVELEADGYVVVDLLRSKFDVGDMPTVAYIQGDGTVWSAPCVYTRISSPFGYRTHPITGEWSMHRGVDLPNRAKAPIRATRSGVVTYSGYNDISGYYVVIDHLDGIKSYYLHMYKKSDLSKGDVVVIGDCIGGMGTTGRSTGVHLHFGIKKDGEFVDPMNYIGKK